MQHILLWVVTGRPRPRFALHSPDPSPAHPFPCPQTSTPHGLRGVGSSCSRGRTRLPLPPSSRRAQARVTSLGQQLEPRSPAHNQHGGHHDHKHHGASPAATQLAEASSGTAVSPPPCTTGQLLLIVSRVPAVTVKDLGSASPPCLRVVPGPYPVTGL